MPQLGYSQDAIIAQPGMPFDGDVFSQDRVSRTVSAVMPFGILAEMDSNGNAQPMQTPTTLAGTVTVTAASAAITFSTAQTLPQGQKLIFSDQPGVVYVLAAALAAGTAGTLDRLYSGAGGAGKTTSIPLNPNIVGISILNPLAEEQNYVPWSVPVVLAGTVTLANASATATFTTPQTLAAGTQLTFPGSSQPGVIYFVAMATSSTTATLTTAFTGTGAAGLTAVSSGLNSSCPGLKIGRVGSFLRRGRIWVLGDGGGTPTLYGAINVNHSTTGANPQGVFTFSAYKQTVGNEIDPAPGCVVYQPNGSGSAGAASTFTDSFGNTFTAYPVEINV